MWDNPQFVYKAPNWTMPNLIKAYVAELPEV
jgi:hypothetical protein